MAALHTFKVTYLDDREPEVVRVGLGPMIQIEKKWPTGAPLLQGMLFGVWVARGGDPTDDAAIDAFSMEVANVEPVAADDTDPTRPAASGA